MISTSTASLVRLGDVCSVRKGTTITEKDSTAGTIPVVAGGMKPSYFHGDSNRGPGAVTVSASGANAGFVAFWDCPIWASDCATVEPNSHDQVSSRFVFHYLKSIEGTVIAALRRGAAQPHVYPKDIQELRVPLPPIDEQRRIAAVLDAANALRSKRLDALRKLNMLTQAIFAEMFGDPVEAATRWPVKALGDIVRGGTTVTYGIVQAGEEFAGGTPYIRTGDIVDGEIRVEGLRHTNPAIADRFPRSRVATGEIVMSIRATVGTTAEVPAALDGANLTQGTARISPGEHTAGPYLLEFLRTPAVQRWIQSQVKGATFREITLARLRQLAVIVPPPDLQAEFADRAMAVRRLVDSERESIASFDALFASLGQRAFRGEL